MWRHSRVSVIKLWATAMLETSHVQCNILVYVHCTGIPNTFVYTWHFASVCLYCCGCGSSLSEIINIWISTSAFEYVLKWLIFPFPYSIRIVATGLVATHNASNSYFTKCDIHKKNSKTSVLIMFTKLLLLYAVSPMSGQWSTWKTTN